MEIKEIAEFNYAGIDHLGVSGIKSKFGRLLKWSMSKDVMQLPDTRLLRIFYDSFKDTDPELVRMRVGVTTPNPIKAQGEIKPGVLEPGKSVVGRFEMQTADFKQAWSAAFKWMNEQGHRPADRPPFEIYQNDFRTHPEGKCIVDLCIPVQ